MLTEIQDSNQPCDLHAKYAEIYTAIQRVKLDSTGVLDDRLLDEIELQLDNQLGVLERQIEERFNNPPSWITFKHAQQEQPNLPGITVHPSIAIGSVA